jgi:hypothetical protein
MRKYLIKYARFHLLRNFPPEPLNEQEYHNWHTMSSTRYRAHTLRRSGGGIQLKSKTTRTLCRFMNNAVRRGKFIFAAIKSL